jgi:hypothetical protein
MAIDNYEKLKKAMLAELIESQYAEEVARLLELRPIEDEQAQPELVELITQRALSDDAIDYTEYPNARMDLASRALHLNGLNPQGENFGGNINRDDFNKLLDVTLGEGQGFVDDDMVKLLIKYQNDKESYNINDQVKGYLDSYLDVNLARIVDIADKKGIQHEPVEIPEPSPEASTERALEELPSDELVTENDLDQSVATVERGDLDYEPDYVRNVDTENEARKAISKIISNARLGDQQNNIPSVNYVERKVVDKLKSFVKNKAADALDKFPLDYPSESLFSDSLSEMDDNGRVTKVHLHYKRNKVVMPTANSPKEVYDIMAAKVMEKGIKNPYIKANFTNPRDAEKFIRSTIESLTAVGYDIEDMSCHPRNAVLFESIKEQYNDMINTIEEAPVIPVEPELSNENEMPTLEEVNLAVSAITASRVATENPMPVEQFSPSDLNTLLEYHRFLEPVGEDVNGDVVQLTPRNIDTVNIGVAYVEKLVNKIGTDRGLGAREAEKLSAISPELIQTVFADKPELLQKLSSFEPQAPNNTPQQDYQSEPQPGQGYDQPYPQDAGYHYDNYQQSDDMSGGMPPIPPNWDESQGNEQQLSPDEMAQPPIDGQYPDMGGAAPMQTEAVNNDAPEAPMEAVNNDAPEAPMEAVNNDAPEAPMEAVNNDAPEAPMEAVNNDAPEAPMEAVNNDAPENSTNQGGGNQLSQGDEFMMSIANTAKKNDGSLDFMSSKQIKTVAIINHKVNLPDGDPQKIEVSGATMAMIEKVKSSVARDIEAMKGGERVSKERYKALVSQTDRVISVMAGDAAVADINAIKEKSSLKKESPAPIKSDAPDVDTPTDTPQSVPNNVPVENQNNNGLNIEGEKGKAQDLFALPVASHEEKLELDIPREPEEVKVDLFKLDVNELEELQAKSPEVVSQALSKHLSEDQQLPGEQNKFDGLPESVKNNNRDLLGIEAPEPQAPLESENKNDDTRPENTIDDPSRSHPSPSRKR